MLKLRLARAGRNKRPFYRVVVQEHTSPRDGRFIEIVGHYDPLQDPPAFNVKEERVQHWLSNGAQPTVTVHRFLAQKGLIAEYKTKPRSKKADAKIQAAKDAAAAAARAETEAAEKAAAEKAAAEAPADEEAAE